ncbi:MAG TPA: hypothetical protein VEI03_14845 [Stellaceae bacterium]|nr:hypothetical protein [Stellaceae bacterium]
MNDASPGASGDEKSRAGAFPKLRRLWLLPPLAFARLGSSPVPLDAFFWGPNDERPGGTGKTTIRPAPTLYFRGDGTLFARTPSAVYFKDQDGFRPVCPFFELHGEWEGEGGPVRGPITPEIVPPSRLRWRVEVANLKPYNMTLDRGTEIRALIELAGDDTEEKPLKGESPPDGPNPLIPRDCHVPLGRVRLNRPDASFPGYRLRFHPGGGFIYGPSDLPERWRRRYTTAPRLTIPADRLFLNPKSAWCRWKKTDDPRRAPEGQFAKDEKEVSLGLVDDICDGIITCGVDGLEAHARVVVAPPDFAPDRRPPISLADGLKDRVDRASVSQPRYYDDMAQVALEIRDLMERAFETMGQMNLDALCNLFDTNLNHYFAHQANLKYPDGENRLFEEPIATASDPLPLTAQGRQHHHRYISIELFFDFVRKRPDLIEKWIREPMTSNPFYTYQMPPLMRNSTGGPLHLTRRQYQLLLNWSRKIRETP